MSHLLRSQKLRHIGLPLNPVLCGMSEPRLTFLAIDSNDLDASISFYRLILGDPLKDESHDAELNDPWYGGKHAACSWTHGAFLHFAIYPTREPNRPQTTAAQIGFHVADFDSVHKQIVEEGTTVVQEPRIEPWGKTARYLDPDGNIVSITEAAT